MIPATYTPRGVSFIIHGRPRNVMSTNPSYDAVIKALKDEDIETLESIMDVSSFIAKITNGRVRISDDEVRFDNVKVPDYLAQRIIEHNKQGFPIDPLCRFAERLMSNPAIDVREDLYKWIENGDMPVYPDGHFAAYKAVRADFTPHHSGPYGQDQSVGKVVEMPREKCDSNRNSTCSYGLHFCSFEYIPSFSNSSTDVILILKIDPADVVAIPTDYNLSKGRTCRFEVMGTVPYEEARLKLTGTGVYSDDRHDTYWQNDDEEDEYEDDISGPYGDLEDDHAEYDYVEDDYVEYDSTVSVMIHKPSGKVFNTENLIEWFNDDTTTMQSLSEQVGIPRSTLSDWKKKLLG